MILTRSEYIESMNNYFQELCKSELKTVQEVNAYRLALEMAWVLLGTEERGEICFLEVVKDEFDE